MLISKQMKRFILLFALIFLTATSSAEELINYQLLSASGFADSQLLISGITVNRSLVPENPFLSFLPTANTLDYSELSFPDNLNQFLIYDLQSPVIISTVNIHFSPPLIVASNNLEVFSGEDIINWKKIDQSCLVSDNLYTLRLENTNSRYLKILFGTDNKFAPLRIQNIRFQLASVPAEKQALVSVSIPDAKITSSSAFIEYETSRFVVTSIVYGSNFDYLYSNTIGHSYTDALPKFKHRLTLYGLTSKTTYIFRVRLSNNSINNLSKAYYFSTK